MKQINFFSTFDMGLAAALVSEGFVLETIERSESTKRVGFVFNNDGLQEDMAEAVELFWNDKLKVKAQTYFNNIKMLKNRIHSD